MAENTQFKIRIGIDIDQAEAYKEVQKAIKLLQSQVNQKKIKVFDDKGAKLYRAELAKISKDLTKMRGNLKKTSSASKDTFKKASAGLKNVNKHSKTLSGSLVSALGKFALWAGISTVFYGAITGLKNMISTVIKLETEMTNFKIVSGATDSELRQVDSTVNNLVSSLGALKSEVMGATTEFARAGYSMADSMKLAEQNIIGARVGFSSLDEVSTILISSLKAFNLTAEDSKDVVNDLFVTSKESAVTFSGLGQAIRRSGNALKTAGASYQQSLALIASANESIQDPATVGSGLKTISARLRGIDKDSNLPKLTSQLRDFGVEIENGAGGFRNVYDILNDLQGAFRESNDEFAKQAVLEELAGKRRANILAGLLNNFEVAQDVLQKTTDDINSAEEAQNELLETGAGQIELMKGNWEIFAQTVIDSDGIKGVLGWINRSLKDANATMAHMDKFEELQKIFNLDTGKESLWIGKYVNYLNGAEFKKAQENLNKLVTGGTEQERQSLLNTLIEEQNTFAQQSIELERLKSLRNEMDNRTLLSAKELVDNNNKIKQVDEEILIVQNNINKSVDDMAKKGYTFQTIAEFTQQLRDGLADVEDESEDAVNGLTEYEQYVLDMQNVSSDVFQAMIDDWEYLTDEMKKNIKLQLTAEINGIDKRIEANKALIQVYGNLMSLDYFQGVGFTDERSDKLKMQIDQDIIAMNKLQAELDSLGIDGSGGSSTKSTKSTFTPESQFEKDLRDIEFTINQRKENINRMTEDKAQQEVKILKDNLQKKIGILQKESDAQLTVVEATNLGTEANENASKQYQKLSLAIGKAQSEIYGYNEELQDTINKAKELGNEKLLDNFKDNVDDYFDNLKQKYKDDLNEFEKSQKVKIKILNNELKTLRRTYETSEFEEREERILEDIAELEAEKQKLSIDNSLSAKQRKYEIDKELAEEKLALEDEREQRTFNLAEDAIEDKIDLVNDETDARKEAYDKDIRNLETYQDQVENLMDDFVDNWANYGTTIADAFKNAVLPTINEMNKMLGQPLATPSSIENSSSSSSSSSSSQPKMSSSDSSKVDNYSDMWHKADDRVKDGTYTKEQADRVKEYAHDKAEEIRKKYGFSGGASGSSNIPVYHDGGVIGGKSFKDIDIMDYINNLSSNEMLITGQVGETVLTERQMGEIANGNTATFDTLISINNPQIGGNYKDVAEFSKEITTQASNQLVKLGIVNIGRN